MDSTYEKSVLVAKKFIPAPPPLPIRMTGYGKGLVTKGLPPGGHSCVSTSTKDLWDRLFDEGRNADVIVNTDCGGKIYAHSSILGMASPVLKGTLTQFGGFSRKKSISIRGVPDDAVRVFIRFLYSSCYEKEELEEFCLPLLVLSHVYVVPQLKRECELVLENGLLNTENVLDIFQLALLCNAPRLSFMCHRMILKNFKVVSSTEGWRVMKESHPVLEKELQVSMIYEENRQRERIRKANERKIYAQLYEAMEALVHICREGCRTIGPHDKDFKVDQDPCSYGACKGLELLVRHFSGCKLRVPGRCIHCKRMWQFLELHSRLCTDSDVCRVPLCRNFKDRMRKQNKKDEMKWKLLVKKILRVRCMRRIDITCMGNQSAVHKSSF